MKWTKDKPTFTKECLLLTASKIRGEWHYSLFEIKQMDAITDEDERVWYWGIFTTDGDEWDSLDELKSDMYCKLPFLKKIKFGK